MLFGGEKPVVHVKPHPKLPTRKRVTPIASASGDDDQWEDIDFGFDDYEPEVAPTQPSKRVRYAGTKQERRDQHWADLLQSTFVAAFLRGVGRRAPRPDDMSPVETEVCSCALKRSKEVLCVFKCGK